MSRYRIEPLQASHAVEAFDCGDEALNRFLIRFALANQRARASRTYVALAGDAVVGFHTLVVGEVSPEQAPERIRKGLARHPIPLMVLARLVVAVHAKDERARGFYEHSYFRPSLSDPLHLFVLLKDVQGIVAKQPWVRSPPGEGCRLDPNRSLSTEAGICG